MGNFLYGFQTPNSKLLGSTSEIITLAVVVSVLLVLLIGPPFLGAVVPKRQRHTNVPASEGQGHWPAENPEDRHFRDGGSHLGRPASWAVVGTVAVAFLIGGIALITKTHWLFWTCVGLVVLGAPAGKAVGIMNDTVEWGSSEAAQAGSGPETEAAPGTTPLPPGTERP